ncbi:hypothetical protein NLI96_g1733 [Meripilus lineatus]|uniref:Uncharacterized protein n=1 Tax=Meripilus lineatus TaxID=2056292 RepID=A0AAD5V9Z0_9APHY|nr:hypothetical protein NLI96_g1733 [Physisporinus lineatus]
MPRPRASDATRWQEVPTGPFDHRCEVLLGPAAWSSANLQQVIRDATQMLKFNGPTLVHTINNVSRDDEPNFARISFSSPFYAAQFVDAWNTCPLREYPVTDFPGVYARISQM